MQEQKVINFLENNKDQTYFLSQVNVNQLKNVLFPIGNLNKSEVRDLACENNLIVHDKKYSTGICFIGERNYQTFVQNYLKKNPGNIIETHNGLMNYTIGQRKNVGLSGNKKNIMFVGKM